MESDALPRVTRVQMDDFSSMQVTLQLERNIVKVFNVEPATYSIEYDLKGGNYRGPEG